MLQFGRFCYDSAQRLLYREGELLPLAPKATDTLHALLERSGQVVEKDELMRLVWPDCVVEEVGLARNISLLRKALGDDAQTFIETIPKRGYRFAAPVSPPTSKTRTGLGHWIPLALATVLLTLGVVVYWQFYRPSRYLPPSGGLANLAVVPFECLSPDLEREAYGRRLSDALVAEISKLDSVQLISPSTVRRYQRFGIPTALMARMLFLHVVLEGTVETLGNQIRVSVHLTDVHSGKLVWAETYYASTGNTDPVEPEIVQALAAQVGRRLSR